MDLPKYFVGETIVSDQYMGEIESAFFDNGAWNYNIGTNADIDTADKYNGYKSGPKFIEEKNVIAYAPVDKKEWRKI